MTPTAGRGHHIPRVWGRSLHIGLTAPNTKRSGVLVGRARQPGVWGYRVPPLWKTLPLLREIEYLKKTISLYLLPLLKSISECCSPDLVTRVMM